LLNTGKLIRSHRNQGRADMVENIVEKEELQYAPAQQIFEEVKTRSEIERSIVKVAEHR
jgi:hypothetical protein